MEKKLTITYNGMAQQNTTNTLIREDDIISLSVQFSSWMDLKRHADVMLFGIVFSLVKVCLRNKEIESRKQWFYFDCWIAAITKKATVFSIGEVMKVGPGRHGYAMNGEWMESDCCARGLGKVP